jgi:hypothetical protein
MVEAARLVNRLGASSSSISGGSETGIEITIAEPKLQE